MRRLEHNERIQHSIGQHSIDVLIVDPIAADAKKTSVALRRVLPNISTVRLMHANQVLQLMLERGLLTAAPQLPRLILLEIVALADGKALLKRISADQRTRNIPVVVFSTTRETIDIEDARSLRAAAYVLKPSNPTEYESEVARIASRWLNRLDNWESGNHEEVAIHKQIVASTRGGELTASTRLGAATTAH